MRPVVLFALRREMQPFRRLFRTCRPIAHTTCPAWHCDDPFGSIELYQTGLGPAAVERALVEILPHRPTCVLLAGFSGALTANLSVGQLILAHEVRTPAGASYPVTLNLSVPEAITGAILATERIVSGTAEKESLHASTGALAVDLESATAARRCYEAGVPFGCLRAISDDVTWDLPAELDQIVEGERIRPWRLFLALCRRPGLIADLLRLARQTRLAAEALAQGLRTALNEAGCPPGSSPTAPAGE